MEKTSFLFNVFTGGRSFFFYHAVETAKIDSFLLFLPGASFFNTISIISAINTVNLIVFIVVPFRSRGGKRV